MNVDLYCLLTLLNDVASMLNYVSDKQNSENVFQNLLRPFIQWISWL